MSHIEQRVVTYKQLLFWQKAKHVSLLIIELTRRLPNERIAWIIADQVLKSSFSVGACIAEGYGKYKGKEYARFTQMALGSARETEYWLELLLESFPSYTEEIAKIIALNNETIKMLIVTVNTLKRTGR
jgi:four helix bundle protein